MSRTIRGIAFLLALVGASLAAPPAAQLAAQAPRAELSPEVLEFVSVDAPVVALTHVRLVDGTGAAPVEDATVVIRDGIIAAVGPAAEVRVPADAHVMDLRGHTVIPGLVGMHNHTFYTTATRRAQLGVSAPRLYLASGVTTVRTTGSYQPYAELNLKRSIDAGRSVGPRMHVAGPYLTGPTDSYMTGVSTAEEARRVVAYWAEEGATWFKAYTQISREALRAAVDEAHRRGLRFTGHLCSISFREAVELGMDNVEHGFFVNTDWDPEKAPDECPSGMRGRLAGVEIDSPEVRATIRNMVDNGMPMTSTLAVYELSVPDRPPLEQRTLQALAPEMREEYLATRQAISRNAVTSVMPTVFRKALAFEKAFHDAGGLLAAGVDPTGIGGALPGFGDQRNFELLIEAGFTPVEAIRVMSLNGATILRDADEYGSVEAGKRADLVVIQGDPVARPTEIRNVTTVFKDGIGYDSAKLIQSVRGVVGVR
jgi:imidazolonepropionase-like amidohydrolase